MTTFAASGANSIATGDSIPTSSSDRGFIAMRKAPMSLTAGLQVFTGGCVSHPPIQRLEADATLTADPA
jgi:hypothetical protein